MKGFVEVISPGLYSTIQDSGRIGFRKYGVPPSGAMDKKSADMANLLLNNSSNASVMEITLHGPVLLFSTQTQIVLSGADISPKLNEKQIPLNKIIGVANDDILSFGLLRFGARCYLAVKGGFQTEKIMGSHSYFTPVTTQQTIAKGDKLLINSHKSNIESFSLVKTDNDLLTSHRLECSLGPEFDLIGGPLSGIIPEISFSITKDNDRMGYRLQGQTLPYPAGYNMLTSSVLPGTVQLIPSGQLIVLMQDCQTTGGYPRILQLTRTGINTLAQKKAGDVVSFEPE